METKELIKKLRTCSYLDENLNEIVGAKFVNIPVTGVTMIRMKN